MSIFLSSRLRRTIAWLALCALCFGAGAPTVSRWLAAQERLAVASFALCEEHGLMPSGAPQDQARMLGQMSMPMPAAQGPGQQPVSHHGGSPDGGFGQSPDDMGDCCGYCTLFHHWPCALTVAVVFAPPVRLPVVHRVAVEAPAAVVRIGHRPQLPRGPPLALV